MPKKRSHGDGGLYYLKSRKMWRGVYDNGYKPDGSRDQRYVHSKSQKECRAKLDELIAEIKDGGGVPINKQMTVNEWAEHWLTTICRPKLKPNTLAAYESVTRTWITPIIGKKKVAQLIPSDVRLVTKGIIDAGKSSSTARKAFNILSTMLEAARKDRLTKTNICADVDAPSMAKSARGSLTLDQAKRVLSVSAGDVDGSRWWLAILGGLRQSERLGARWSSVDFDKREFTVEWALDEITSEHGCGEPTMDAKGKKAWPCGKIRGASCPDGRLKLSDGMEYVRLAGRLCLVRPKSGKSRTVPLTPKTVEMLLAYREASKNFANPYDLLFAKPGTGAPFRPNEDEQLWENLLRRALVIDENTTTIPTTHWARHTTATMLMDLGVDAKVAGEALGHGTERVTRGYQHVASSVSHEAMERLGDHLVIEQ